MRVWLFFAVFIFCCHQLAAETYDVFEENGKKGLKDERGQVVIPPRYEALGWSDGSLSVVHNVTGYRKNGLWGIIDLHNAHVTKAIFYGLIPGESDLLIAVKRSSLSQRLVTGCVNTAGKEVLPFQYESIAISNFRAVVSVKAGNQYKHGLLDGENKVLIPIEYRNIRQIGALRYLVEDFNGKCSLFSESGRQLTAFTFDAIQPFRKNYAVFVQEGKHGVVDREGVIRIQPKYREIQLSAGGDSVYAKPFDSWTILDGQNNVIQKLEADSITGLNAHLFRVRRGDYIQLVNARMEAITSRQFSSVGSFVNGKAVFISGDKKGIVNVNGHVEIESKYDDIKPDKNVVMVAINNKWMLLDTAGNVKTTKQYEYIGRLSERLFHVKNFGRYGVIRDDGKEIISCVYDTIQQVLGDLLVVKFLGEYGVISIREEWVVPPQPHSISLISENRYILKRNATLFLKSMDGSIIYFTENPVTVQDNYLIEYVSTGGTWKINMDGRIASRSLVSAEPYEIVFSESEGLSGIRKDGRYGFIDDQGRLRIANRYEDIKPFSDGLAAIKILNKWGFINHEERIVIQPVYDEVTHFQNGVSVVRQKGLHGIINVKGTPVVPVRYQSVTMLPTKRFILFSEGKYGLADKDGRMIVIPKFDHIEDADNGYLIVARDGKFGVITTENVSTVPLMYDYISYDSFNGRYFALKKTAWEKFVVL